MLDTAGAPSALESQIRQLDKALDESRFQMQQTENIIRSKTPTGPELDSSYRGYVSTLTLAIPKRTWKSQLCDKERSVCGTGLSEISKHHAALELVGLGVQNKALLGYCLSKTGLCSDPLNYYNDQPVPLCRERREIHLIKSNNMLWLPKVIGIFPNSASNSWAKVILGAADLANRLLTRNLYLVLLWGLLIHSLALGMFFTLRCQYVRFGENKSDEQEGFGDKVGRDCIYY